MAKYLTSMAKHSLQLSPLTLIKCNFTAVARLLFKRITFGCLDNGVVVGESLCEFLRTHQNAPPAWCFYDSDCQYGGGSAALFLTVLTP